MKHLSTLIAVKNLTIIQFTKIIQDLFYLDEFILDSLIIHLENCTIYHDESAIAFCIQYQNNDYEYIFNEAKQNIYLSINKRNNQFIDLITYLNKYHFLNNNHFSYIQPNIKNMNDLNQVIEFIENKTILPVIYLNISLKDFKNEILTEIQSTAYILTSEDENFHQAFQKHFHLRNNSYILYLNHEFQKISFLKKESPQEFIEKVKIKIQSYVLQRTYSFPYNMKDFQHHIIKKIIENHKENDFLENSSIEQQVLALEDKKKNLQKNIDDLNNQILILENQNKELGSYIKQQGYYPLILKGNEKEFSGVLEFHDVGFAYDGAKEEALSDISFTARPGETTAIIGSTGCGKTTLLNLIPRFYDVTSGSITIDGIDVREMSQEKLRSLIGYVPQKGVLFSGTIASNLKFAGDQVSDEMMKEAADIAQAVDFIEEKEEKYNSPIAQGGTNVSGGQKQRLSIARAIAKNPKIFLFDDSFSALDYKTDVALRKKLNERVKDATVLIVAQRISTILHADKIIVLEEGRIAGIGTHEELLAGCETYQEIASSQLSEAELKGGVR